MHIVWIVLAFSLPWPASAPAAEPPKLDGEIVIGATVPLTGSLEPYGLSAYYGAVASVRKVNAEGGINGKKLVLEWLDTRSRPEIAAENVRALVAKLKTPVILGPLVSEAAMNVRPVARELGVVVVSPMASLDALVEKDPWLFRTCFSNSAVADALARFQLDKFGARTCAILFDSRYAFSRELAVIFERKMTGLGGRCVAAFDIVDEKGEKDYRSPLAQIAEKGPDFIFTSCLALEATELVRAAKEMDVGIQFCASYTWDNQVVMDGSGTRLAGTSFASSLAEQTSNRALREFFEEMGEVGMDTPDVSAAFAYDSVTLIAQALRKGETAEEVRKALLSVRNVPLVTGRFTITPEGDTIKPVMIRMVERNGWRMVPVYAERYDPPRQPAAGR